MLNMLVCETGIQVHSQSYLRKGVYPEGTKCLVGRVHTLEL